MLAPLLSSLMFLSFASGWRTALQTGMPIRRAAPISVLLSKAWHWIRPKRQLNDVASWMESHRTFNWNSMLIISGSVVLFWQCRAIRIGEAEYRTLCSILDYIMRQVRHHRHEHDQQTNSQCPPNVPGNRCFEIAVIQRFQQSLIGFEVRSHKERSSWSPMCFCPWGEGSNQLALLPAMSLLNGEVGKTFDLNTLHVFSKANNRKTWNPYHTPTSMPQNTAQSSLPVLPKLDRWRKTCLFGLRNGVMWSMLRV